MKTHQVIFTTSIPAAADLTRQRFVGFDGNVCAAGAKAIGVADIDAAAGRLVPVDMIGNILIEAGAAVAAGAEVQSDASGRAIPKAAGVGNGYALDAASAAGELIRIARGI